MPDPLAAPPVLPSPVAPGEAVRADDWNRMLAAVVGLYAARAPRRDDLPDPVRAVKLAQRLMIGVVAEVVLTGTPIDGAYLPSGTKYVFVAADVPSIRLGAPGVGVLPDYGRPVRGNEARIYPQPVDSIVLLLRMNDAESPGGVRTYSCVLGEQVARRLCTGGR